jgi:hypothetical protein
MDWISRSRLDHGTGLNAIITAIAFFLMKSDRIVAFTQDFVSS